MAYQFVRSRLSNGPNAVNGIDPTADALTVYFTLSGTATCTGGADYTVTADPAAPTTGATYNAANCTGTVSIAASGGSGTILITPVNDAVPENNETVIATINANQGATANNYTIGAPTTLRERSLTTTRHVSCVPTRYHPRVLLKMAVRTLTIRSHV